MIGKGALAIWFAVDPSAEADLNAWYPRQHLPERLSVPGFLRGRRCAAVGDGPPYFTFYETADPEVLSSAAYLERLNNPTDWTRRVLPTFRQMVRNVYRVIATSRDERVERHLLTVRINPDSGRGPAVREWMERGGMSTLRARGDVGACGFYISDTGGTSVVTEERKLVGEVTGAPPFLVVCELPDPTASTALEEFWRAWGKKTAAEVSVSLYRLLYGLAWI